MQVSKKLLGAFCKYCNVPIQVFPPINIFQDRLQLFDPVYDCIKKYDSFLKDLEFYGCEEGYFSHLENAIKGAVEFIKSTEGYRLFNDMDVSIYPMSRLRRDFYIPSNDGKEFFSISMRQADFNTLNFFSQGIFGDALTWEKFIGRFTHHQHLIESDVLRQEVLSQCNPERQKTYCLFIMSDILKRVQEVVNNKVVYFDGEEIILEVEDRSVNLIDLLAVNVDFEVPLTMKRFTLHKVKGCEGYVKKLLDYSDVDVGGYSFVSFPGVESVEIVCDDKAVIPLIIRALNNQFASHTDKLFVHEPSNIVSRFVDVPDITVYEKP